MKLLSILLLLLFVSCGDWEMEPKVPEKPFVVIQKSPRRMKYDLWDYQYLDKNGNAFWTVEKGKYNVGDTIK